MFELVRCGFQPQTEQDKRRDAASTLSKRSEESAALSYPNGIDEEIGGGVPPFPVATQGRNLPSTKVGCALARNVCPEPKLAKLQKASLHGQAAADVYRALRPGDERQPYDELRELRRRA